MFSQLQVKTSPLGMEDWTEVDELNYWLVDVWEEEAERVNFIGNAQLYRRRSIFEIHAM